MDLLEVNVLGTFRMNSGGQTLTDVATDKARALLTFLAFEGMQPRTTLTALLWSDSPQDTAFENLRKLLYRLRRRLDESIPGVADLFIANRHSVQLDLQHIVVDVLRFQTLLTQCDHHAHETLVDCDACLAHLAAAVDLYRGELLAGFGLGDAHAFEEWLLLRRETLQQQALLALAKLTTAWETRGDVARAHTYCSRSLALDPLREDMQRQQIRLLVRLGQRNQALQQYESLRRLLQEELGVEPDPATTSLYDQIRHGDVHLLPVTPQQAATNRPATPVQAAPIQATNISKWGEVPETGRVYGRDVEMVQLQSWLSAERCQLVAILGIGGVGKTTLAATGVKAVAADFDKVIWRSLLNAPPLDELLRGVLQSISQQSLAELPPNLDGQLALLLNELRQQRCLLVLDNLESILQAEGIGEMRAGYEGYAQVIRRLAESRHDSTLLLTSRERPQGMMHWEQDFPWVHSLRLEGLDATAGHALLNAGGLGGQATESDALVERYSGHPLALKLVAETIQELFAGDITAFLAFDVVVFDEIQDVLDQQFARLSDLEREVMAWLAIERETVSFETLAEDLAQPAARQLLFAALRALQRRALLEKCATGFTLQNVVMEYTTDRLVAQICQEIETEQLDLCNRHALIKAQAKEYVRQSQARLVMQPVAARLLVKFGKAELVEKLQHILSVQRLRVPKAVGYAAGNILNLLLNLECDVRGYNLSGLCVWQAYLSNRTAFDVNFSHADLTGCSFTSPFNVIFSVAYSPDGQIIAGGSLDGSVYLWEATYGWSAGAYHGHAALVYALAFSGDGTLLASGSEDTTIRLWDRQSGQTLHVLRDHTGFVNSVAFSPDGTLLASGSDDHTVRVWHVATGQCIRVLNDHRGRVNQVAFSPDGKLLASCSDDHTVRVRAVETGQLVRSVHEGGCRPGRLAFSPDGATIAHNGMDGMEYTVRMWEVHTGRITHTLRGHQDEITSVAFSLDGTVVASGADDNQVRLWDAQTGESIRLLQGHSDRVASVAFRPRLETGTLFGEVVPAKIPPPTTHNVLVSSSWDRTVRIWDVQTGQILQVLSGSSSWAQTLTFSPSFSAIGAENEGTFATADDVLVGTVDDQEVRVWEARSGYPRHILPGHRKQIRVITFSPDGRTLLSGGLDQTVRVWDLQSGQLRWLLQGHTGRIDAIAASHDGRQFASSANDHTVRLWDAQSGKLSHLQQGGTVTAQALAFSPDDAILAGGTGPNIYLWNTGTGELLHMLVGHTIGTTSLAFSPDGALLAGGGYDHRLCLWDVASGRLRYELHGHHGSIFALAFNPVGKLLATASGDHQVCVWDVQSGALRHRLEGHIGWLRAVAFSPDGTRIASGSSDGTVKLWDVEKGLCLQTWRAKGPYAGMNITGVTGITEAQKAALKALGAYEQI